MPPAVGGRQARHEVTVAGGPPVVDVEGELDEAHVDGLPTLAMVEADDDLRLVPAVPGVLGWWEDRQTHEPPFALGIDVVETRGELDRLGPGVERREVGEPSVTLGDDGSLVEEADVPRVAQPVGVDLDRDPVALAGLGLGAGLLGAR